MIHVREASPRANFVIPPTVLPRLLGVVSALLLMVSVGQAQCTGSETSSDALAKGTAQAPGPNRLSEAGLLLLRAGSFKAAQISLTSLCRTGMQGAEILENIGLAYLRISPKDAPAGGTTGAEIAQRVGHAACLAAQKRFEEARKEYYALEEQYPRYPYIHYAVGRFWADMDDVSAAVAEFQEELKNQPKDINSRLEIAAGEYKLDSAAGLPYAEEAVKLNPLVPSAHYLLGLLYLDTDNYKKAIPELEIAQKVLPKNAKIYFALGSAYARAGRKEDAARARAAFAKLNRQLQSSSEAMQ